MITLVMRAGSDVNTQQVIELVGATQGALRLDPIVLYDSTGNEFITSALWYRHRNAGDARLKCLNKMDSNKVRQTIYCNNLPNLGRRLRSCGGFPPELIRIELPR